MSNSKLMKQRLKNWLDNPKQSTIFIVSKGFNHDSLVNECRTSLNVKLGNMIELDSDTGIDQVRHLKSILNLKSVNENRLVVVKDVEELNSESSNALLKSIEEPNAGIYFVITTTKYESILPTIKSRCLRINLKDDQIINPVDKEIVELAKKYYKSDTLSRYKLNRQIDEEQIKQLLEALLNINYHLMRRQDKWQSFISKQDVVLGCLNSLNNRGNKKIILNYLAISL